MTFTIEPSSARAAGGGFTLSPGSGMVSLDIAPGVLPQLPGGVPDHHITVVYLGKGVDDDKFEQVCQAAAKVAANTPQLSGTIGGQGTFTPSASSDGKVPVYAVPKIPGVEKLRAPFDQFNASEHKDFHPHVTMAYVDPDDELPPPVKETPVTFTHLTVHRENDVATFPLTGTKTRVEAGALSTRDWKKWEAEHPYLKKGRQHHGESEAARLKESAGAKLATEKKLAAEKASKDVAKGATPKSSPHTPSPFEAQDAEVRKGAQEAAASKPKGQTITHAETMTDEEYAQHRMHVEHELTAHGTNDLMRAPDSTHNSQDRVGGIEGAYTPERKALHDKIIAEYDERAKSVPSEHRAIITAGLGGAGKSTVLRHEAQSPSSVASKVGIQYATYDKKGNGVGEPTNFVTLNPDDIKERLSEPGATPEIDHLSPMEASPFTHEEASALTERIANRMQSQGKNVIHDVTLNSVKSGDKRIDSLRAVTSGAAPHGYHVSGVMVDVSTAQSLHNAEQRHRGGQDRFNKGIGQGGRYVPSDLITGAEDPNGVYRSKNRAAFETLKGQGKFDKTITIDNEGYAGKVIDESGSSKAAAARELKKDAALVGIRTDGTPSTLDQIGAYRDGTLSLDALVDNLATRDYAVPSFLTMPGADMHASEEIDRAAPGTFGEITEAHDQGALTDDEYGKIHQAAFEAHAPVRTIFQQVFREAMAIRVEAGSLEIRNWAKWKLEHPYIKKGYHHHFTVEQHEHHAHAPSIEPGSAKADLPVPSTPKLDSDVLQAQHDAFVNEAKSIHSYAPGSTRAERFEAGYAAARMDASTRSIDAEQAHELSEQHDAVAKGLQANQAQAKRYGAAAGYHAHSLGAVEPEPAPEPPDGGINPVGPRPMMGAREAAIATYAQEAKTAHSYTPGSTRGQRFEAGYVQGRTDAYDKSMTPQQAYEQAGEHHAAAAKLQPNQARAKREGLAAGYQAHVEANRTGPAPAPQPGPTPEPTPPIPGPTGTSNPYPPDSDDAKHWQRAHDFAIEYAQTKGFDAAKAMEVADRTEGEVVGKPGAASHLTTEAGKAGLVAGYREHARNAPTAPVVEPGPTPRPGDTPADSSKYLKNSPKYKAFNAGHATASTVIAGSSEASPEASAVMAKYHNEQAKGLPAGVERARQEGMAAAYTTHANGASPPIPTPTPVIEPGPTADSHTISKSAVDLKNGDQIMVNGKHLTVVQGWQPLPGDQKGGYVGASDDRGSVEITRVESASQSFDVLQPGHPSYVEGKPAPTPAPVPEPGMPEHPQFEIPVSAKDTRPALMTPSVTRATGEVIEKGKKGTVYGQISKSYGGYDATYHAADGQRVYLRWYRKQADAVQAIAEHHNRVLSGDVAPPKPVRDLTDQPPGGFQVGDIVRHNGDLHAVNGRASSSQLQLRNLRTGEVTEATALEPAIPPSSGVTGVYGAQEASKQKEFELGFTAARYDAQANGLSAEQSRRKANDIEREISRGRHPDDEALHQGRLAGYQQHAEDSRPREIHDLQVGQVVGQTDNGGDVKVAAVEHGAAYTPTKVTLQSEKYGSTTTEHANDAAITGLVGAHASAANMGEPTVPAEIPEEGRSRYLTGYKEGREEAERSLKRGQSFQAVSTGADEREERARRSGATGNEEYMHQSLGWVQAQRDVLAQYQRPPSSEDNIPAEFNTPEKAQAYRDAKKAAYDKTKTSGKNVDELNDEANKHYTNTKGALSGSTYREREMGTAHGIDAASSELPQPIKTIVNLKPYQKTQDYQQGYSAIAGWAKDKSDEEVLQSLKDYQGEFYDADAPNTQSYRAGQLGAHLDRLNGTTKNEPFAAPQRPISDEEMKNARAEVIKMMMQRDQFRGRMFNSALSSALEDQEKGFATPGDAAKDEIAKSKSFKDVGYSWQAQVHDALAGSKTLDEFKAKAPDAAEESFGSSPSDYVKRARQDMLDQATDVLAKHIGRADRLDDATKTNEYLGNLADSIAHGTPIPAAPQLSTTYKRMGDSFDHFSPEHVKEMVDAIPMLGDNEEISGMRGLSITDFAHHRQIMNAGSAVADRIDARSDVSAARKEWEGAKAAELPSLYDLPAERREAMNSEERTEYFNQANATRETRQKAEDAYGDALDKASLEELAQERSLGEGDQEHPLYGTEPSLVAARKALAVYPTDWVRNSGRAAAIKPVAVKGKPRAGNALGMYVDNDSDSAFARKHSIPNGGFSSVNASATEHDVMVHEFGHRMEYTTPGINRMEAAHIATRQGSARSAPLGSYGRGATGIADEFVETYSGRIYEEGNIDRAHEVLTTGTEAIFGERKGRYGRLVGQGGYKADPRHRAFILGMLASHARSDQKERDAQKAQLKAQVEASGGKIVGTGDSMGIESIPTGKPV